MNTSDPKKVKALKPGDTIGIVAPASQVDREIFLRGVSEIETLGYKVQYSDLLFSNHYYFAGTHSQRAENFMEFFTNPKIKAVFCARGGYGSQYLLDLLDTNKLKANPKIFLGYSDVTTLLQYLENQCDMVCFHGPMVSREFASGEPYYLKESLQDCLTRTSPGAQLHLPQTETLMQGRVRGRLTGGCLSLLTACLGTPYELCSINKILFLEDVNTKPYQLDRMLMQLKLAGKLEEIQGLIFGEMLSCGDSSKSFTLQEIIYNVVHQLDIPVWYGLPSGHTSGKGLTLPFGVEIQMDTSEKWLKIEESAVIE